MRAKFVHTLVALALAAWMTGLAWPGSCDPLPQPVAVWGTQAGRIGPNLMADSSFESLSVENNPMPGWPVHWETIENDIMEYNPSWGHPQQFDSTTHDWSGGPSGNIGNFNAVVYPPGGHGLHAVAHVRSALGPGERGGRLARLPAGLL